MKLIWQLLRQHVSVLQLAGFLVTNLVGVAIVLTAVQLYRDVTPALQAPDSFLDNDFIILTKEVEGAGIGKTSFTQTELAELAEQPFTEALGEFTPARYSVMGGISLAGIGMRTYLFFESVPDRFLDVRSDEWGFEEGSEFVPIILPRNYLNLYNFGFASTRGLPQVSEDLVRGITLDLDLSGRGQFRNLKGRVVAFSNRLNTILVPEEFIRWSNRRFADKPAADPSRIILEVRNAADDRIHEYLALHRYQIEGGAGDEGRASYFLRMATGVVVGVGLWITVLSFFSLLLSIFLMLQKNLKKLEDLLMLGYTPAQVARPYQLLALGLNLSVLACAVPVVVWVRSKYLPMVRMLGEDYAAPGIWGMLLAGILVVGAVVLIDMLVIRHKVNGLWTQR